MTHRQAYFFNKWREFWQSFSHPDYTVGSGIAPDHALTARGLRNVRFITAGREFHPAPKDAYIPFLFIIAQ